MLDMHFHSKLSDGRKTNGEIIKEAKKQGLEFITCTDHDIINTEFPTLAIANGIKSVEAVEISGFDENLKRHLHLTCYSQGFNSEIHEVLKLSRAGRQEKIELQVELLVSKGFQIEFKKFFEYFKNKGINPLNLNSSHLSSYIYGNQYNIDLIKKLTGEKLSRDEFIKECLKDEGKYHQIGAVTIPEYEPNLQKCVSLAKQNSAILSIAHPNSKFTTREFKRRIEYYLELGINAVEINAKASQKWVKLILNLREKYNFILTFGSDCHFKSYLENEHGELGKMNPYVPQNMVNLNLYYIQKKLGLIKNASLDPNLGGDLGNDVIEYVKMREEQPVYNLNS
ncbi:MAG: PHP domain-containing protein [Candidatus Gracilibacteria bacterium]|nr:PHP domain-containing protein [Candidatus Gracilibacteria bacterium]MDD2909266.1 PHP domain-containing protein [Candidatus Gracilibacteria bacterium]